MSECGLEIRRLNKDEIASRADDLARLLIDAVDGGASVGFLAPLRHETARAFWLGTAQACAGDGRVLLAALDRSDGALAGTVQVIPAAYENQPHRADIAKLLVLRAFRRRGVGEALMSAAEDAARASGKTLLTLDTATGAAERLYQKLGWRQAGEIPDYALMPDASLCATRLYYKAIA